ncbi:MAG: hypothetical protein ACTXOO_00465 [Sodalis sp. (in: enterobacteria)]
MEPHYNALKAFFSYSTRYSGNGDNVKATSGCVNIDAALAMAVLPTVKDSALRASRFSGNAMGSASGRSGLL